MPEIRSYMEEFPFPFYIILRDVNALPETLSDALRQWFELVTASDHSQSRAQSSEAVGSLELPYTAVCELRALILLHLGPDFSFLLYPTVIKTFLLHYTFVFTTQKSLAQALGLPAVLTEHRQLTSSTRARDQGPGRGHTAPLELSHSLSSAQYLEE